MNQDELQDEEIMTAFESWYIDCIVYAIANNLAPDDYLWNLQEPGIWVELMNAGLTSEDAAESQFRRQ